MRQSLPYQPILLRLLHGATTLLSLLALISGFLVYNTYDKRWGGLAIAKLSQIQDLHGTIALTFLLVFPLFALYAFHVGDRRLVQANSLQQLKTLGQPQGWIALHRFTTTLMLFSSTFAVLTGRMMKEEWLPAGDIQQPWYLAHLVAWLGVLVSIALHVLLGVKVGGVPLLLSMVQATVRQGDTPRTWLRGGKLLPSSSLLKAIEVVILGGILLAFILPAFNV